MEKRWLPRLGPPLVALVALVAFGLLATASAGAMATDWEPPDCRNAIAAAGGRPAVRGPSGPADLVGEPWYRLDPVLDESRTLAGQRLEVGRHGEGSRRVGLPPESFVAGPFGRLVLVGSDDGRISTLRTIDVSAGCARLVAREASIIRRAVVDPTGTSLYEFRVDRLTRADRGIWRRPIAGGRAEQVVEPLGPDARFGRTFSTELSWSLEGDRLVVEQCGQTSCRMRLLDPRSGRVATIARPELGELIGVGRGRAIAYAACRGLPCALVSVDLATGRSNLIARAAGLARLAVSDDGPRLVYEAGSNGDRHLQSTGLDGGSARRVAIPGDDLRLVPSSSRSAAGTRLPDGWLLLAPDGRGVAAATGAVLVRAVDGLTVPLAEVTR